MLCCGRALVEEALYLFLSLLVFGIFVGPGCMVAAAVATFERVYGRSTLIDRIAVSAARTHLLLGFAAFRYVAVLQAYLALYWLGMLRSWLDYEVHRIHLQTCEVECAPIVGVDKHHFDCSRCCVAVFPY